MVWDQHDEFIIEQINNLQKGKQIGETKIG